MVTPNIRIQQLICTSCLCIWSYRYSEFRLHCTCIIATQHACLLVIPTATLQDGCLLVWPFWRIFPKHYFSCSYLRSSTSCTRSRNYFTSSLVRDTDFPSLTQGPDFSNRA